MRGAEAISLTGHTHTGPDDRLRDACRQVESLFLNQLLAQMNRPAFGEGLLGRSGPSRWFVAQRNRALAEEMGRRGELGLGDMLYRELTRGPGAGIHADKRGPANVLQEGVCD